MTRVTDLPCEVIVAVFKQLDHIQSLPPCLLACRHFYYSYKENPRSGIEILRRQVCPTFLPYAIATEEASRSPRLSACLSTTELLDTLQNNPDILIDRLRDYPLMALARLGYTHDLVEKHAKSYSSGGWTGINQPYLQLIQQTPAADVLCLSSTEQLRVCRAFYRFELYTSLLRSNNIQLDQEISLTFPGLRPWENEQLACAYNYVEEKIIQVRSKAAAKVSKGTIMDMNCIDPILTSWIYTPRKRWVNANNIKKYDLRHESGRSSIGYAFGFVTGDLLTALDREDDDKGPFIAWNQNITGQPPGPWMYKNKFNPLPA
ncbi:hypothetical protein GQX73_g853 [Xylaria multiplex]|uniref:F-box domain-containing protein n=1 Tax=Xylaria multiplex TaxID=323545 RepID=A0A7C8IWT0_9PEZI|nr:hypothetical protein GQX73_g853 [Xylaria multiplex]